MESNLTYQTLRFEIDHHVGHITINRPEAANALNLQMCRELLQVALRCDEDPAVRAVLLSSTGKIFCAGGDLKEFSGQENLAAHLKEMTAYFHTAVSRLNRMDAPVVTVVKGTVGGAGMSLVCASDIVYAGQSSRFTMAYTRAGLSPDGSSTYFLSRLIGLRRALELALTNRLLSAQEALEWGILTRVLPDDEVLQEALALATQLASGPTKAFGATKRLLHSAWTTTLETQMEYEARTIADIARTADAREGIAAFLEKRPPEFRGE